MAKKKKKTSPKKKASKKTQGQSPVLRTAAIAFIVLLLFSLFGAPLLMNKGGTKAPTAQKPSRSTVPPQFKKEGTLSFIQQSGDTTSINIELARSEKETQQGLMYRTNMTDQQGMLFLFSTSEPRSFWMKNTVISLDILFVDENYRITTIRPNTKPFSQDPVRSNGNAMFVVEVNAGFCERYGVQVGDNIVFDLMKGAS